MHMTDALLAPAVAAAMYVASGTAAAISIHKLRLEDTPQKLPVMAVSAALVFAGQMINYAIPGTGSSGHICGGMLLAAILGPEAGFLSMIAILTIQCLFFADGGLLALGANIWNMAFYGCFVGYYLVWRPLLRGKAPDAGKNSLRLRITLASILGCVLSLQLGAFSVVLETSLSGITDLPFAAFCGVMQPIHLAIGLIEGVITAALLIFISEARPRLLQDIDTEKAESRFSLRATLLVLAAVAAVTAGGLSLLASDKPDGLEWSLFGGGGQYSENMGLDEENYGLTGPAADKAAAIQDSTAFMPDYADRDNTASGTGKAGLIGGGLVALAAALIYILGRLGRRKKAPGEEGSNE